MTRIVKKRRTVVEKAVRITSSGKHCTIIDDTVMKRGQRSLVKERCVGEVLMYLPFQEPLCIWE